MNQIVSYRPLANPKDPSGFTPLVNQIVSYEIRPGPYLDPNL